MDEEKFLAEGFEANRARLRAVAYRMLGSRMEAEDAVQEAWLRLNRTGPDEIENLAGWLTTVVARVCLDMLRLRKIRGEEPLEDPGTGEDVREQVTDDAANDPEHEALFADSVGLALLVVLKTLTPAERVAFVLHDMFDLPFEEIAPILGRSPAAVRQLASRARRRVQGAPPVPDDEPLRQRQVVEAFRAASRRGDLQGLIAVLDPDVVFRADAAAVAMGGIAEVRGAAAVAETFKGRAQAARLALVDGAAGLTVVLQGQLRIALGITIADGRIVAIDAIADPEHLRRLEITPLT
jgi:RNA polymerase sigma-70 factor (ECF subfamily)